MHPSHRSFLKFFTLYFQNTNSERETRQLWQEYFCRRSSTLQRSAQVKGLDNFFPKTEPEASCEHRGRVRIANFMPGVKFSMCGACDQ